MTTKMNTPIWQSPPTLPSDTSSPTSKYKHSPTAPLDTAHLDTAPAQDAQDDFDWINPDSAAKEESEEFTEAAKGLFGLDCCYLPSKFRFFIYLLSGLALPATPALVSYLVIWKPGDPNVWAGVGGKGDLVLSTEIARWSLWLGSIWCTWLFLWFFFDASPYLIASFLNFFGGYSDTTRARLEYLVAVKLHITITTWTITVVALFIAFFHDMKEVDYWLIVFHVLATTMVFTICLLIHKLALQIIAVRFHRTAYKDRIQTSKKNMKILDTLKKYAKSRGLTEYFIPAEMEIGKRRKVGSPTVGPGNGNGSGEPHIVTNGDQETQKVKPASPFWRALAKKRAQANAVNHDDIDMDIGDLDPSDMDVPSRDVHGSEEVIKTAAFMAEDTGNQFHELHEMGDASSPRHMSRKASVRPSPGPAPRSPTPRSPALSPSRGDDTASVIGRRSRHSTRLPALLKPLSRRPSMHTPNDSQPPAQPSSAQTTDIIKPPGSGLTDFHANKYAKELAKMDITSHVQAGKLARKIFLGLGGEKGFLTLDDFVTCFPNPTDAADAFSTIDQDGNGTITRKEIKDAVIKMYRERRGLFRAMRDLSHALGKLDAFFYAVTCFVTFCIALPIFGISLTAMLPFTSFVLALSFVFGTAARTAFESLLFLFVTHPYDTGDRVIIDNQNLIVEEVGVLTTVFKRMDGQIIYAPNTLVAMKLIHNLRRSPDQSESIELQLNFDTPEDKIRALRERMLEFVKSEPREYQPVCDIHIADIENMNKLKVNVILKHRGNWQDGSKRWGRRTMFMYALKRHMTELDIRYATPPQHKAADTSAQPAAVPTFSIKETEPLTFSNSSQQSAAVAAAAQNFAGGLG